MIAAGSSADVAMPGLNRYRHLLARPIKPPI